MRKKSELVFRLQFKRVEKTVSAYLNMPIEEIENSAEFKMDLTKLSTPERDSEFGKQIQQLQIALTQLAVAYQAVSNPPQEVLLAPPTQETVTPAAPSVRRRKGIGSLELWIIAGIVIALATVLTCGLAGVVAGGAIGGFLAIGSVFSTAAASTTMIAFGGILATFGAGFPLAGILAGLWQGLKAVGTGIKSLIQKCCRPKAEAVSLTVNLDSPKSDSRETEEKGYVASTHAYLSQQQPTVFPVVVFSPQDASLAERSAEISLSAANPSNTGRPEDPITTPAATSTPLNTSVSAFKV